MSVLVTSEIFRVLINTLTPYDKYSSRYLQIFCQQFQNILSLKWKTFLDFLLHFQNVHQI